MPSCRPSAESWHEAGHAVTAAAIGSVVVEAVVGPRSFVRHTPPGDLPIEDEVAIVAAGYVAQLRGSGHTEWHGSQDEADTWTRLYRLGVVDRELVRQVGTLKAGRIVVTNWESIRLVAEQLETRRRLSGLELAALLRRDRWH